MTATRDSIAELFLRVVPQVTRAIAADVRRSRLEIEPIYIHLLGFIEHEDRSLGEFAELVSVSPPTMSKTVSTLEARRWVQRKRSETDGRVVLVSLTVEGRAVLERARGYMRQRIADALGPLDHEQIETLASGLQILGDVFTRLPSPQEPVATP